MPPGAKMAHRASTCAFHRFLSCAAVQCAPHSRTATLLWTSLFLLCAARLFLAGPSFSFPLGSMLRAVTQSLSGCCLRMCPMNRHLLLLTSSLSLSTLALSSSSLLLILSCHLIFSIDPKCPLRACSNYHYFTPTSGGQDHVFLEMTIFLSSSFCNNL